MIGLAAAAMLLAPTPAPADGHPGPLSVAVRASGAQHVSYAIEVSNTTDHEVTDAVITQQLPTGLDHVAATPAPRRTGRRLTWTLTIPAHGTARITTTGVPGHRLGARPLDHATQVGALHRGYHRRLTTTVCAREDTGPQSCATGRGALRPQPQTLSRWERGTLATVIAAGAAITALLGGTRVWRRRRRLASGGPERAGVES